MHLQRNQQFLPSCKIFITEISRFSYEIIGLLGERNAQIVFFLGEMCLGMLVALNDSGKCVWQCTCHRLEAHKNLRHKKQTRCRRTTLVSESLTSKVIIDQLKNWISQASNIYLSCKRNARKRMKL